MWFNFYIQKKIWSKGPVCSKSIKSISHYANITAYSTACIAYNTVYQLCVTPKKDKMASVYRTAHSLLTQCLRVMRRRKQWNMLSIIDRHWHNATSILCFWTHWKEQWTRLRLICASFLIQSNKNKWKNNSVVYKFF